MVKYEQHFVILNFEVNEKTVTEKLWRFWDVWKFENFRKIRGEERFQPRPQRGSQWGGGFYGDRLNVWLFYGYRVIFFSYG